MQIRLFNELKKKYYPIIHSIVLYNSLVSISPPNGNSYDLSFDDFDGREQRDKQRKPREHPWVKREGNKVVEN